MRNRRAPTDSEAERGSRAGTVHVPEAPAISVVGLGATYNGEWALRDVSFEVEPGEGVAVVGPNAAGKSTLMRVLAGLLPPAAGTASIHGHGPCRHTCIAYVPQRSLVDWRFPVTLEDVVMMGRAGRLGPLRRPRARDRAVVRDALDAVELLSLARARVEELSGGQQQRLFIARALAQEAHLVLLDEPFAGLDVHSREEVLRLLEGERLERLTRMVALHDLGVAAERFVRVLLLHRSMIGYGSPAQVLTPENLRRAYGSCVRVVEAEGGTMLVSDSACRAGGEHEHH